MPKAILVVLDSVGCGYAPDAAAYGDEGANTLGNVLKACPVALPNLERLGLCHIPGVPKRAVGHVQPYGAYGCLHEKSAGKDTTTGHWELMCLERLEPFPVLPEGLPPQALAELEKRVHRRILWNRPASGTEIIQRLGKTHVMSGAIIGYTSGDSVYQIAAHEEVVPIDQLYEICQTARDFLQGALGVARVIARPFVGVEGSYERTANRHDFSLDPDGPTALDVLSAHSVKTIGIGKIYDIFNGKGVACTYPTTSNGHGMATLMNCMDEEKGDALIFVNLVEFDSHYGHRRDVAGYARALQEFDALLPYVLRRLGPEDVILLTADHGCDPTYKGTDHTRERVPLILYGAGVQPGPLRENAGFSDVGATLLDFFKCENPLCGASLLPPACPDKSE